MSAGFGKNIGLTGAISVAEIGQRILVVTFSKRLAIFGLKDFDGVQLLVFAFDDHLLVGPLRAAKPLAADAPENHLRLPIGGADELTRRVGRGKQPIDRVPAIADITSHTSKASTNRIPRIAHEIFLP